MAFIHENHTRDIQLVSQFYKYCLDLQYARAAAQDTQHVVQLDDVGAVPKGDIFQQLADWKVQQSWQFPEVVESRLDRAVWGRHAMTSLLQWFRSCAWPMDDTQDFPNSKLGISWTEIAVAVAIKHGMWMPIKRKQQDSLEHIIQPRDLTQCSYLKVTLAEQTANISYMVKHLKSMLMQDVMPTIPQGKVSALLVYGFQGSTGLRIRPQFPEQKQVVDNSFQELITCKRCQILIFPTSIFGRRMKSCQHFQWENGRGVQICSGGVYEAKTAELSDPPEVLGVCAGPPFELSAGGGSFLATGKGFNSD
jgi:hypothetical protein